MQNEISSYDTKTKLPEILRRVENGEAFTITKRGKPIADLIPSKYGESDHAKTKAAISNILKAKKHKVPNQTLKNLMKSGQK